MKTIAPAKKKVREREMMMEEFIALPDAEKNRIVAELAAESPEQRLARSRPLNALRDCVIKVSKSRARSVFAK